MSFDEEPDPPCPRCGGALDDKGRCPGCTADALPDAETGAKIIDLFEALKESLAEPTGRGGE